MLPHAPPQLYPIHPDHPNPPPPTLTFEEMTGPSMLCDFPVAIVDKLPYQVAQDKRVEELGGLHADERAFVRAALAGENDQHLWDQVADYLLDRGQAVVAERIRRIRPLLEIKAKLTQTEAEFRKESAKDDDATYYHQERLLGALEMLQWIIGV